MLSKRTNASPVSIPLSTLQVGFAEECHQRMELLFLFDCFFAGWCQWKGAFYMPAFVLVLVLVGFLNAILK